MTYLVFQLLRFTRVPIAGHHCELLPHIFTFATPKSPKGDFKVVVIFCGTISTSSKTRCHPLGGAVLCIVRTFLSQLNKER